jgi:hypothetical protein
LLLAQKEPSSRFYSNADTASEAEAEEFGRQTAPTQEQTVNAGAQEGSAGE